MTVLARPDVVARLHQETHWASRRDGHLVQLRLDEMTDKHLLYVLRWLREHAEQLHRDQVQILLRAWLRRPGAHRDLEVDIAHLQRQHPATWLEETALVRRLVELTPRPAGSARGRRLLPHRLRRSA